MLTEAQDKTLAPAKRSFSLNSHPGQRQHDSLIPEAWVMNAQGLANKTVSGSLKAVLPPCSWGFCLLGLGLGLAMLLEKGERRKLSTLLPPVLFLGFLKTATFFCG